jgi:hypothetical protein
MTTGTTGAIVLRPMGNTQGGYYFFSLTIGRRMNRNRWTELPIPADVIDRVHTLSRRILAVNRLSFADRNGNDPTDKDPNDDDAADGTWNPGPDDDNDDNDDNDNEDTDDGSADDDATIGDTIAGVDDGDDIAVPEVRENNFPANDSHNTENENDIHDTENLVPNDAPETDKPTNDGLERIPEHPETEHNANTDQPTNEGLKPNPEHHETENKETTHHKTENDATDNGGNQQALDKKMEKNNTASGTTNITFDQDGHTTISTPCWSIPL